MSRLPMNQLMLDFEFDANPTGSLLPVMGDQLSRLFGVQMRFLWGALDIAEQELARARLSVRLERNIFRALAPTELVRGKTLDLYRHHVRELIGRAAATEPLEPATDAELLCVMCETATVAPLNVEGQAVAEHLFAKIFPEGGRRIFGDAGPAKEKWAGQVAEQLAVMRRKYGQKRGGGIA